MTHSKLAAALAWAARGFKVFPLKENGREPAVPSFLTGATDDPAMIRAYWLDPLTGVERPHNIGCLTSDWVVADIDVKKGKPGVQTYYQHGGHFDTLIVQTPSGGYHAYFMGPSSSNAPIGGTAGGLDIRSHNGFVVAPGSVIDGRAYAVVRDAPVAWVPIGIEAELRAPNVRKSRDAYVEPDTPTALENAKHWLLNRAPIAVEGQGGDNTTYAVSCALVRDYALSEFSAYELLLEHWNSRCAPPWDADELWSKVEHASDYGTGDLGAARPEAAFGSVSVTPPEPAPPALDKPSVRFGNALAPTAIPPRPWLIPRLLMRRAITLVPAAGSMGKSILTLELAAHMANGKDFGPYRVLAPSKSVLYNAEDDLEEQSRRLQAICVEYRFDYERTAASIMFLTNEHVMLSLATVAHRDVSANEDHVSEIIRICSEPGVGMFAADPLVELHSCDEQDNSHMRSVMAVLRRIAREADVAVLIPHHTSKAGGNGPKAGNPELARGASAIVNSARIAVTLFPATDADREVYGISEEEKHRYVRLDDAKMNLSLASSNAVWFLKAGVRLPNGDEVGVLRYQKMDANAEAQRRFIAMCCLEAIVATSGATVSMQAAIKAVKSSDNLYETMSDALVRAKIEKALTGGVTLDGGTVMCERTNHNGRDTLTIRME